jgi:hypothetical protein
MFCCQVNLLFPCELAYSVLTCKLCKKSGSGAPALAITDEPVKNAAMERE